jgi:tripartite-type tricarboxylate transporter receptor subunit TctC
MRKYLAGLLLIAGVATASAQNYPMRPITMVVPFAAGGAFDILGRTVSIRMGELLGQQVVVENTSGGAGITGTMRVATAAPDGYTILLASVGTHAYNPAIYENLRYNAVTDFTPIILFADQPMALIVRKTLPVNDLKEFIAYAKANAAKMQYGSAGVGSTTHLSCTMLNKTIGVEPVHVPYRGGGPAAQAVLTGDIDYACLNMGGAIPLISGGMVKGLASLSPTRAPNFPLLATADEQGLKGFNVSTWNAFVGPKGMPPDIVAKLNQVTRQTIDTPAVNERLRDQGVTPPPAERRSPEYLAQYIKDEVARWDGPIKAAGIKGGN